MSVQLSRLRKFGIFGLLLTMMGCAAQSSYVEANRTRELVRQALQIAPGDPDSLRAQISLEAGETSLGEARYGRATARFHEANELAEKVLAKNRLSPEDQISQVDQKPLVEEPAEEYSSEVEASTIVSDDMDRRMGLPAEALAKYLSMKDSVPLEIEDFGVSPPKHEVPVPGAKSLRPTQESSVVSSEESKIPNGAQLVEASSQVAAKTPPAPVIDPSANGDEVVPGDQAKSPTAKASTSTERERKKLPGLINFPPREQALNDPAMNELDQLSRFLVENPSNTLVLQAIRGPSESEAIVSSRFTSIRSYLSARGVPDDQIRLEDDARQGPNAGFEMFVIEH